MPSSIPFERQVDEDQNESVQRRGIDSLIQLALASRGEGAHKVGYVRVPLARSRT